MKHFTPSAAKAIHCKLRLFRLKKIFIARIRGNFRNGLVAYRFCPGFARFACYTLAPLSGLKTMRQQCSKVASQLLAIM
jgi:hypothetical protein